MSNKKENEQKCSLGGSAPAIDPPARSVHFSTDRLHLRPGCSADAPALFQAIADLDIVRNLSSAPWPYTLADAEALASCDFDPAQPRFFIFRRNTFPAELIGVAGLDRLPSGGVELGYWIAKEHWNSGFASEAARQMVEIARVELKLTRLLAGHFLDNPASGRVLKKLGFRPEGDLVTRHSRARDGVDLCQMYAIQL